MNKKNGIQEKLIEYAKSSQDIGKCAAGACLMALITLLANYSDDVPWEELPSPVATRFVTVLFACNVFMNIYRDASKQLGERFPDDKIKAGVGAVLIPTASLTAVTYGAQVASGDQQAWVAGAASALSGVLGYGSFEVSKNVTKKEFLLRMTPVIERVKQEAFKIIGKD